MKKYIWPVLAVFFAAIIGCSGPGDLGNTPSSDTTSIIIGGGDTTPTVEAPTSSQPKIIIYPTIINQNNDPITNLDDTNFYVTIRTPGSSTSVECKVIVTPHNETTGGNISLCMTLDKSGSMQYANRMDNLKSAANSFIDLLKTGDELGLIAFSTAWEILSSLEAITSASKTEMKSLVNSLTPLGATALFDSISAAIDQAAGGSNDRKAIIAMTDGVNTYSLASSTEVINKAILKNIPVYAIALAEASNTSDLEEIARQTGGIYYTAASASNLTDIYSKVSSALRSYYTIEIISPIPLTPGQIYIINVTIQNYGTITSTYTFTITL